MWDVAERQVPVPKYAVHHDTPDSGQMQARRGMIDYPPAEQEFEALQILADHLQTDMNKMSDHVWRRFVESASDDI